MFSKALASTQQAENKVIVVLVVVLLVEVLLNLVVGLTQLNTIPANSKKGGGAVRWYPSEHLLKAQAATTYSLEC